MPLFVYQILESREVDNGVKAIKQHIYVEFVRNGLDSPPQKVFLESNELGMC